MATSLGARSAAGFFWAVLSLMVAFRETTAGQRSALDGPWSGEARCVLVTQDKDYQDEQTHIWRLTGSPQTPATTFQTWPATWSVQGSGRREVLTSGSESWTLRGEMNAPLTISEVTGGRIRIGSRHGLLTAPLGSITITPSIGRVMPSSATEWQFPLIEDAAASTTVTGKSTRTLPVGVTAGWRQPREIVTTETCTWNFVRGDAISISQSSQTVQGVQAVSVLLSQPVEGPVTTRREVAGGGVLPGNITLPPPPPPTTERAVGTSPIGPAPVTAVKTVTLTGPSGGNMFAPWTSGSTTASMSLVFRDAMVDAGKVYPDQIQLGNIVPGQFGTALTLQCLANYPLTVSLDVDLKVPIKTWTEPASQKTVFTFERTVNLTGSRSSLRWRVQGALCTMTQLVISGSV